jgi:hypothetical protein
MEDTYQLTGEQVKHDSQMFFSKYSLFSLTSYVFWVFHLAVVVEYYIFPGNAVEIIGPSGFGKFVHHSRITHCKIVRRIYRILKGPAALSLICKKSTKNLFCGIYICLMAVYKMRSFVVTDNETIALYLAVVM